MVTSCSHLLVPTSGESLTSYRKGARKFDPKAILPGPENSGRETRRMKLLLVPFPFFPDPWACLAGASELASFNQLTSPAVLTTAPCTIDLNGLHSPSDPSVKQTERNALDFFSTCAVAA